MVDPKTDRRRVGEDFYAYRERVRAGKVLHWPYAYSAPVEHGGSCLECDATNGGHRSWCEAVS